MRQHLGMNTREAGISSEYYLCIEICTQKGVCLPLKYDAIFSIDMMLMILNTLHFNTLNQIYMALR